MRSVAQIHCVSVPGDLAHARGSLRQRQAERTRAELVAAGRETFAAAGYYSATVEGIAATIGATRGAFYRHFSDKREMFDEVVCQVASEIVAEVWDTSYALSTNSAERERHAARLFLQQLSSPGTNRILAVDGPVVLGYHRWSEIVHAAVSGPLTAGVSGWSKTGSLPERLVEPIVHLLVGIFQTASIHLASVEDPGALAADYEEALVYIIGALRGHRAEGISTP